MVNCIFLGIFFLETLVRAALFRGGWLGYFASPWNLLDLLMIVASGALELVDILDILDVSHGSTLIGIVRMVSSLRTLNMLNSIAINTEVLINQSLESIIHDLQAKCSALETTGNQIRDEIDDKHRCTQKVEEQLDSLLTNMLGTMQNSWNMLVPSSFILDQTKKNIKPRPARSKTAPTGAPAGVFIEKRSLTSRSTPVLKDH